MSWKSTADRYSRASIALHWLMVLLFILIYASIELRGIFPKDSDGRTLMKDAHFMLGLTVFVLVWLRLLARTLGVAPDIVPAPPAWQTALATVMHWALYLFMITMPVLGYLILSHNHKPVFFYGIDIPPLTEKNVDLARQIKGVTGQCTGCAEQTAIAADHNHHVTDLAEHLTRRGLQAVPRQDLGDGVFKDHVHVPLKQKFFQSANRIEHL